ncbi:hypothetical protein ACFXHA_29105 [Nocardia sp. NPDC059240]|uniref:hypothetical protein n=1 Tax=Nocardia sp. NPDC059240 TaxID=3346786 RepID=UPI00368FC374
MARSVEHDFVTGVFISCAQEMSRSEVFGYAEADRGVFDFACTLTSDHSRNLVGQTLTHHAAGIDKDLASLLHDSDSHLPVYLYSDEARHIVRVQEFLHKARVQLPDRVGLLRHLRYPSFDADNDDERRLVAHEIKSQMVDDLLLNVTFGHLSSTDIDLLLLNTAVPGLLLAVLDYVAAKGFVNFPDLARAVGAKEGTVRTRVPALVSAGMLSQAVDSNYFQTTTRARVLLRISYLLMAAEAAGPELAYILAKLGLGGHSEIDAATPSELLTMPYDPPEKRIRFMTELHYAKSEYGAELAGTGYLLSTRPGLPIPADLVWVGR